MNKYMAEALRLAEEAFSENEVPVGAVVVKSNKIVGRGRNHREEKNSVMSHAEIEAIEDACKTLGTWHLDGCEIYVTLEPCLMCAGAIINARIKSVHFGAYDKKAGAASSVLNAFEFNLGTKTEVYNAVAEYECSEILKRFFERLR